MQFVPNTNSLAGVHPSNVVLFYPWAKLEKNKEGVLAF